MRTKHAQHRAQRRATRVRSERLLVRSRLSNFVALKASGHRGFCPLSFGPRCASPVTSASLPVSSRSFSQLTFSWSMCMLHVQYGR